VSELQVATVDTSASIKKEGEACYLRLFLRANAATATAVVAAAAEAIMYVVVEGASPFDEVDED
jgi:hypothetical protein